MNPICPVLLFNQFIYQAIFSLGLQVIVYLNTVKKVQDIPAAHVRTAGTLLNFTASIPIPANARLDKILYRPLL
jgi:hypothetical protein